jgi:hypothetical protein
MISFFLLGLPIFAVIGLVGRSSTPRAGDDLSRDADSILSFAQTRLHYNNQERDFHMRPFLIALLPLLLAAPAPADTPIDSTLYTTYMLGPSSQQITYLVCGSTKESEGCFASGEIGPFGRVGAIIESKASESALAQAGNNFGGTVTADGSAITLKDAGALTAVLDSSGASTLTSVGAMTVSGTVGTTLKTTTTGTDAATTFGATTVGTSLAVTSSGAVSETSANILEVDGKGTTTVSNAHVTVNGVKGAEISAP